MKQYLKPEMKISMFDTESIATDGTVNPLSQPAYGQNLDTFIKENNAVQRNLDFKDAIKFN